MTDHTIADVQPRTRWLIWGLFALSILISLFALGLLLATLATPMERPWAGSAYFQGYLLPIAVPFSVIGSLILSRYPRHGIGWLFFWVGLAGGIHALVEEFAIYALFVWPGNLPGGATSAWFTNWFWAPALAPVLFVLLIFPDGRLPSRRWWPVLVWGIVYIVGATLNGALRSPMLFGSFRTVPNPFHVKMGAAMEWVYMLGSDSFSLPLILAMVLSLGIRFRRSRGVERQQLKWFAYAAAVAATITLISLTSQVDILLSLAVLVWALLPIAVALSILRYRLWDIDLIIRRTLVYAVLTSALALVFFGCVTLLQDLFASVTGQQSAVAIVISTLAIAALFSPLRRRVQNVIDRRFYRRKYDAENTLARFATAARDEVELNSLTAALIGVVDETMQPERVSLWLWRPSSVSEQMIRNANRNDHETLI